MSKIYKNNNILILLIITDIRDLLIYLELYLNIFLEK
jgi:hypothetical protein